MLVGVVRRDTYWTLWKNCRGDSTYWLSWKLTWKGTQVHPLTPYLVMIGEERGYRNPKIQELVKFAFLAFLPHKVNPSFTSPIPVLHSLYLPFPPLPFLHFPHFSSTPLLLSFPLLPILLPLAVSFTPFSTSSPLSVVPPFFHLSFPVPSVLTSSQSLINYWSSVLICHYFAISTSLLVMWYSENVWLLLSAHSKAHKAHSNSYSPCLCSNNKLSEEKQ